MKKYDFTQNDKCLGTFHVGCEADEPTEPTTAEPTTADPTTTDPTTTDPTTADPNGSSGLVPGLLALALPALTAATYSMLKI